MCVGEKGMVEGEHWDWTKPQRELELTSTHIIIVELVALNVLVGKLLSFCMPFLPSLFFFKFQPCVLPSFSFPFPSFLC